MTIYHFAVLAFYHRSQLHTSTWADPEHFMGVLITYFSLDFFFLVINVFHRGPYEPYSLLEGGPYQYF